MNSRSRFTANSIFILVLCAGFQFIFTSCPRAGFEEKLNSDIPAGYHIEAELDTAQKILRGHESVEFFNPTDNPLDVIIFHLFPNAFRDTLTSMASASNKIKAGINRHPGYIDIDSITVDGNQPDSIKASETLLYIYIKKKLAPAAIAVIDMNFEIKTPPTIARYGYDDFGNYLLSHWHPVLVGYQKNKPVIFQYDYSGEFFSNFSHYKVQLAIPPDFHLASTAGTNLPDSTTDSFSYYTFNASRIIDFAFACGPGWRVDSLTHNNINVEILYLEQNEKVLPRIKESITGSLDFFGEMLFEYPADKLTFVDFDPGGFGMELPRMVIMSFDQSKSINEMDLMNTVIHETAHQWFYAVIATNEFGEAWLDEGFASYLSDRAMIDIFGQAPMFDYYGLEVSFTDVSALTARFARALTPLAIPSDRFHGRDYYMNVYGRAAATIKTLEGILGTENFDDALLYFAETYKFKHPDSYDFQASFEESAGRNLDFFFDNYIHGTARVDYEVTEIMTVRRDDIYSTAVEIQRNYDGVLPQRLIVGFADGTNTDTLWDGLDKYIEFEFESETPARWAAIDTGYFYLIDENLANNSRKVQPETGTTVGFATAIGFLVQIFLLILGVV
ncbi:MAG: M1 family metallopeptidase [candidate division Zixibacteria bacterium]|nr:M1 family metallopeptidase [candidate division Zixibacteria bacterium]